MYCDYIRFILNTIGICVNEFIEQNALSKTHLFNSCISELDFEKIISLCEGMLVDVTLKILSFYGNDDGLGGC